MKPPYAKLFVAGLMLAATPAFAAPIWVETACSRAANRVSRRSAPGKGKPMLPIV